VHLFDVMPEDKYGYEDAKRYARELDEFKSDPKRVAQAAREALAALEGQEADTLRLAEAFGKSKIKEEDPELWRTAEGLSDKERIRAFERAVTYLEQGYSHHDAIRRAIGEIQAHH
jgi:hypothetical protein